MASIFPRPHAQPGRSTRRFFLVLAVLAWQVAGICLVSAQDLGGASGTGAPAANPASPTSALTPDERAHLKKVKKEVLANNPDLKAEDDTLNQQRDDQESQGGSVSPDDRKALMAKWHDHMQKIRVEALKIDPTLAPIYAKLDAWRQQHPYNKPATGG